MKVVGAKTTYYRLAKEGRSISEIERIVMRDFPNTKEDTLKRYRNDVKRLGFIKETVENIAISSIDHNSGSDSSNLDNVSSDQNIDTQKDQNEKYQVKEFSAQVKDTGTPEEAQRLTEMYKNGLVQAEPVRIEFIPKIMKRGFDLFLRIPQVKKYLEGWDDKESVDMMFDETETMIKKRIHASSKNSDLWNIVLATGVVGVSMGSHIILNKKHDLTEEKKIIAAKSPTAVQQLEEIEKSVDQSHIPGQVDSQTIRIDPDLSDESAKNP